MARPRVVFVTIGQSPRDDLVPDLLEQIGDGIDAVELGLLDGMSDAEIAGLGPGRGDDLLVSRLRDGRETLLAKPWVETALQERLDQLDRQGFRLIVLLCTGSFPRLASKTLMVEAGRVVDNFVGALSDATRSVGVMVPSKDQVGVFGHAGEAARTLYSHASPYTDRRFAAAGRELQDADFVVMHCMGYDRAMRGQVAEASGRPVVLSRNVVADAVRQLI